MLAFAIPMLTFAQELTIDEKIEEKFKPFADVVSSVVFYPISIVGIDVPIVVILLLSGALFFTLYFKFSNITLLGVAIRTTNGKYDDVDHNSVDEMAGDPTPGGNIFETVKSDGVIGEVTHFQALTAALSATVGLGNIAGGCGCNSNWRSWSYSMDDFSGFFRNVYKISRGHSRC